MNLQMLRRRGWIRPFLPLLLVGLALPGCSVPPDTVPTTTPPTTATPPTATTPPTTDTPPTTGTPPTTAESPVQTIAFGDSTTAGLTDWEYWKLLRDDLGQPTDSYAGQGQNAEPTAAGLDRLRALLDSNVYPGAQVLLYWQGANDVLTFVKTHDPLLLRSPKAGDYPFVAELATSLDTTQANIEEAIRLGRQAGLTVYVTTYFYLNNQTGQCKLGMLSPERQARVNEYNQLLNDRIRQAAANAGAVLADVGAQAETIVADPANYADCNHLSEKGNRIVAGIFEAAMQLQP